MRIKPITILFFAGILLAGTYAGAGLLQKFEAELPLRSAEGGMCALTFPSTVPRTCPSAWMRYERESMPPGMDPYDKYAFFCPGASWWHWTITEGGGNTGTDCKRSTDKPPGDWDNLPEAIWITPVHEEIERQIIEPCGDLFGKALNMSMGKAMQAVEDDLNYFRESVFSAALGKSDRARMAIYRAAKNACLVIANDAR